LSLKPKESIQSISVLSIRTPLIQTYLQDQHELRCSKRGSKLLKACRNKPGIDPVLWLPMSPAERMWCITIVLAGSLAVNTHYAHVAITPLV
ncbi:hypothetical protein BJV82DRAFT_680103, partial [Fennellomyces sp. T-0311]